MSFETYKQVTEAFYALDNKPLAKYPGATKVLSGTQDMTGLLEWRARVGDAEADRIIKESHLIGNSLDKMFNESLSSFDFDPMLYQDEPGFRLWKQLEPTIRKINPIGVQLKVWSDNLKVMGYLDCFGFLNDIPTIIDCKNSKKEKPQEYLQDYFLQCTLYATMIYDMTMLKVPQIAVLVARRDSPFPQIEIRKTKDFLPMALNRIRQYYHPGV